MTSVRRAASERHFSRVGRLRPADRDRHLPMLVLAVVVVVLSFALRVRPDERVEFRFLPGYPLPPTCWVRTVLHVPCPGCGLTRSFVYLAEGDWRRSLQEHPLGWLLALAALAQIPYRLAALARPDWPVFRSRWPKLFGYSLLVLLIATGLARLGWLAWSGQWPSL